MWSLAKCFALLTVNLLLLLLGCCAAAAWTASSPPFRAVGSTRRRTTLTVLPRTHHQRPCFGRATTKLLLANNDKNPLDNDNANNNDDDASEQARLLVERAKSARLEAERMERDLVTSKLQTLEGLLERQSRLSKSDEQDLQDRIDQLKQYMNPTTATTSEQDDDDKEVQAPKEEEQVNDLIFRAKNDPESLTSEELEKAINLKSEEFKKGIDNLEEEDGPVEYVEELTPEDQRALEEVQSIFLEFKDILNTTISETELEEDNIWADLEELEGDLKASLAGNITQEDLEFLRGATGFAKGVWNFVGGSESDWEELKSNFKTEVVKGVKNLEQDELYYERMQTIQKWLPAALLSSPGINETDMDDFVQQVMLPLDSDVFKLNSKKPRKFGDAYALQGTPMLTNGDDLIKQIDNQLVKSGLQDKFQCYYIRDDTVSLDIDEVQLADQLVTGEEELELASLMDRVNNLWTPSILVTPTDVDLAPETPPELRALVSFLAVTWTASFAVDCYDQDLSLLQQVSLGVTSPILLGIFGIQLVHELGHFVTAALSKIEIAFPFTMLPSPSTGLLHTNTQIKSPPKNNNALYDFAISGPLLGLFASLGALLSGLSLTASIGPGEETFLPHLPLEFLQVSTLTSAIIESFLGTDVLLSLDSVSDDVAVHPLIIAGHVGILVNSLNLLPHLPTTDGGRMLVALDTRTGSIQEVVFALFSIFLLVQGFRGFGTCNILIIYWAVTWFAQHQAEVPCRNNVDPANGLRLPLFVASTLLATVALSPAF